jgi:hypothetical protein
MLEETRRRGFGQMAGVKRMDGNIDHHHDNHRVSRSLGGKGGGIIAEYVQGDVVP